MTARRRRRSTSRSSSGPPRADGKHELATVYQRLDLADTIAVEPADELDRRGLRRRHDRPARARALAAAAGVEPRWRVRIEKRIPVAAGLGGGSSDAATALRLANEHARRAAAGRASCTRSRRALGADVPFFLDAGPAARHRRRHELEPLDLPQDYAVLLLLPDGERRSARPPTSMRRSTRASGEPGSPSARAAARRARGASTRPRDLAALPPNDLASLAARRRVPRPRARSEPTSAAPARRSTASSTTAAGAERAAGGVARARRDVGYETCVVRVDFDVRNPAIEHGSSRTGRWLRERRFRFTLWIAAVEGLLYLSTRSIGGRRSRSP